MAEILLVEDNDAVAEIYRIALTESGHNVESAVTAYTAVKTALRKNFDLVIMDLLIEGADGVVTSIALRGIGFTGPIIAVTGGLMPVDETMEKAASFAAKVIKALTSISDLVEIVENLIEKEKEQ